MARMTGIDLGEHAIKVVELDGSYRKTRLLGHVIVKLEGGPREPAAHAEAAAQAVKSAYQEGGFRGDSIMSHPCREAVLRTIEVPFKGTDAIRKVIKAEVEGAIHSHSIDDMVVDFHEIGPGNGATVEGTRVLVAAVPKAGLRTTLAAMAGVKHEPHHVELDAMALYRAADWAGALDAPEAAGDAKSELPATAAKKHVVALLDIGSRSTRFVLVEDGILVDMRTLRTGADSVVDEIGRKLGISTGPAREAVVQCLATSEDADIATGGEGESVTRTLVAHSDVERAVTGWLQRLSRELVRTLAAAGDRARVDRLVVTGGACRWAGMAAMLEEVFGVEPAELDLVGNLQHDLSPEEASSLNIQLATAIGLALGGMDGPGGFDFRREDLAYTRGFERHKFALAVFCMFALFTVVVYGVKLNNDLRNLEYELGRTYTGANADPRKPVFHGHLHSVMNTGWFADERNVAPKDHRDLLEKLLATEPHKRLQMVRDRLKKIVEESQKASGIYEDLAVESGLAVLVRFAELLKARENELGRLLIVDFKLNMPVRNRSLEFTVAFRGSDFRAKQSILRAAIDEECRRPDSPFEKFDERSYREHRFSDSAESGVEGAYFDMKVLVKDSFAPFGTSAPRTAAAPAVEGRQPGALAATTEVR